MRAYVVFESGLRWDEASTNVEGEARSTKAQLEVAKRYRDADKSSLAVKRRLRDYKKRGVKVPWRT